MSDNDNAMLWNHRPRQRQRRPGELLWTVQTKDHLTFSSELQFHGESVGWEAQIFRNGALVIGRTFILKGANGHTRRKRTMSRPRSQYVELEPTFWKFLLRTRRMGYTSKILALLGGFPNPGTFNMQLYDAFAPTDTNIARFRRLADALEFQGHHRGRGAGAVRA